MAQWSVGVEENVVDLKSHAMEAVEAAEAIVGPLLYICLHTSLGQKCYWSGIGQKLELVHSYFHFYNT